MVLKTMGGISEPHLQDLLNKTFGSPKSPKSKSFAKIIKIILCQQKKEPCWAEGKQAQQSSQARNTWFWGINLSLWTYHIRIGAQPKYVQQLCPTCGGHYEWVGISACGDCGNISISYNSCRNRHCPKCQGQKRDDWIRDREAELLPAPYFHHAWGVYQAIRIAYPAQEIRKNQTLRIFEQHMETQKTKSTSGKTWHTKQSDAT